MRLQLLTLGVAVLAGATSVAAEDHLVPARIASERLAAAADARRAELAILEAVLARPEASEAARGLGQDSAALRAGVRSLSEAERHELAARVRALQSDPAAGLTHDVNQLLVIFLIVAIVILVLQAVD